MRNYIKLLGTLNYEEKIENFTLELTKQNLNDLELKRINLAFQKSKLSTRAYIDQLSKHLKENWEDINAWIELA